MSDSSRKSHGIGAAVDKLFRGIEILIAIFLGAMIFFTFMNVILRQFGIGFPWSEEIARICFIYLIYLGAIIAARENQHLMIDTLICKLPPLGQKVLYVIIQGLIIWLMWILTNGAFLNAWNNRNDFWVATHFPVFLVHFAGVLLADTAVKAATVDVVGYSSPANGGTSFSNEVILTFTGDSGAVKQAIIAARDVGMQVLKTLEPSVELKSTTTPYIL